MSKEPNGTTPELIVLGRDEAGKPRAARFAAGHDNLVAKAAKAMNLTVCKADGEAQWQHLKSAVKNFSGGPSSAARRITNEGRAIRHLDFPHSRSQGRRRREGS